MLCVGDQPEACWPEAAAELAHMGFDSTLEYVHHAAREVGFVQRFFGLHTDFKCAGQALQLQQQ